VLSLELEQKKKCSARHGMARHWHGGCSLAKAAAAVSFLFSPSLVNFGGVIYP
jgi:hypothetical protein